jgi:hypothetical protein
MPRRELLSVIAKSIWIVALGLAIFGIVSIVENHAFGSSFEVGLALVVGMLGFLSIFLASMSGRWPKARLSPDMHHEEPSP